MWRLLFVIVAIESGCNRSGLPTGDSGVASDASTGDGDVSQDGPSPAMDDLASGLSCPAVDPPCGGELKGTWLFKSFCAPAHPGGVCRSGGSPTLALEAASFDFAVTFDDQGAGMILQSGAVSGVIADLVVPDTCSPSVCPPMNLSTGDIACSPGLGGAACDCSISASKSLDLAGTFSVVGNGVLAITLPSPIGTMKTPYCVDGNTLTLGGGYPASTVVGLQLTALSNAAFAALSTSASVFQRISTPPDFAGIFPQDMAGEQLDLIGAPLPDLAFFCNMDSDCKTPGRTFCYTNLHMCGCRGGTDCPLGEMCESTFGGPTMGTCVPGCDPNSGVACPGGAAYACCSVPQSVSLFHQCKDVQRDVSNCGGCGSVCSAVNGTPSCSGGFCAIACSTGYGDCDGEVVNGCETSLLTSSAHCGSCATPCATGHSCSAGTCK